MKILNIYFKNINSLEGEGRVHFDQAPISDGGVFAITGANGSGKSSILDVITLGLYGETYRFDRPADHVMTKSTAESFAQVEFVLGDDKYRSSWQVTREGADSAGAMQTPEMTLVHLNGSEQVLEQGAQNVRGKVSDLIGMDFHKFSKSMVLAQGDFAAFLNALDSERMDILEKISGVDIYADYKAKAEEKHAQAQSQLQLLEQDFNAIPVLDAATIEASEHDLADFKLQRTELTDELNGVEQKLNEARIVADLEREMKGLLNKQQKEALKLKNITHNLDEISEIQDVTEFEDSLTSLDAKSTESVQSKKTLNSFRSELEMLQQQLKASGLDENAPASDKSPAEQKETIEKLKQKSGGLKFELPKETALLETLKQQVADKKQVINESTNWLQEHAGDKILLESFPPIEQLEQVKADALEMSGKQKDYAKWTKTVTEGIKDKKTTISSLNKKNKDTGNQIELDEKFLQNLSEGRSLEELQEMAVEQQQRVNNFRELYELAGVKSKLGKKEFFSRLFNFKAASAEEKELKTDSDRLQMEIGRENNIVKVLETAVLNEGLLKKMQADRVHLVDGKACPLCGALEHPYTEYQPAVSDSKMILAEQRKKVRALQADAVSLKKEVARVHKQAEKDEQKDSKLMMIQSQWNTLSNRLNTASIDLDIDNLSLMKDLFKAEKDELLNLNNLVKQYSKKEASIKHARVSVESNTVSLTRLEGELVAQEAEWNNRPQTAIDDEENFAKISAEEKVLTEQVNKQLVQLGEKMPGKNKENQLLQKLKNRKLQYQLKLDNQKPLDEDIKVLEQRILASTSTIDDLNKQLQDCSEEMQQQEMAGLHLSLVEKQKLIADKESDFSRQEQELADLKTNLADKIKTTNYSDEAALRSALSLLKKQPELQKTQQQLADSIESIKNSQLVLQEKIDVEQVNQQTREPEEQLMLQRKSVKQKLDIAKQEVITLGSKLSKQKDLQDRQQSLQLKISGQKEEMKASEADIKLINDENGLGFRQKVQQTMADKLLSESNQILEKISGRYYVRKVASEHGLALQVEDTKQNNAHRLPKTLSGGESFIVSLALALALAEMADTDHAIDSLFLDEGFGNLDAESLYQAMTTLESLQTHGKVVGVISHVEGVRKRIKTQIEMVKKPNGFSTLKMVS